MSQPDDATPEERQVRRLLADARHTDPVPDDVAARLDAVLADLRDEDAESPAATVTTTPPSDLAAARRRRNVRTWLVAAAAVVVIGVGINQVAQTDLSDDAATSGAGADSAGEASLDRSQAAESEVPSVSPDLGALGARTALARLDSAHFGAQVRRLRAASPFVRSDGLVTNGTASAPQSAAGDARDQDDSAYAAACTAGDGGRGVVVPVRYDRQPGLVVFRPVRGDTQVVDLFLCGSDDAERSITLPAP